MLSYEQRTKLTIAEMEPVPATDRSGPVWLIQIGTGIDHYKSGPVPPMDNSIKVLNVIELCSLLRLFRPRKHRDSSTALLCSVWYVVRKPTFCHS